MLLDLYKYEIPDKRIIRYFAGTETNNSVICIFDDRLSSIMMNYNGSPETQFSKVSSCKKELVEMYFSTENFYESQYGTGIKLLHKRELGSSKITLYNPLRIQDETHRRMVKELKNRFRQLMEDLSELSEFLLLLNMCLMISGLSQTKEVTVNRALDEAKKSNNNLDPLCYLWFLLGVDSIYDNLSDFQSESILCISSVSKKYFNTKSS